MDSHDFLERESVISFRLRLRKPPPGCYGVVCWTDWLASAIFIATKEVGFSIDGVSNA